MSFENHAGFNISNYKLQVVEINYRKEQFFLETVDEAYFNETLDFSKDKETKISALFQGAFNELLIRKPLGSNSVSFTLPFHHFFIMQIPYDNTLLHNDLLEEFRWEFSVLYPYAQTKNLSIQYLEIEKNDIVQHNSVLAAAMPRKYIQLIKNFCAANKLKLRFIDNIHLAADRALALNQPLSEKGAVLSVYITDHLSLIVHLRGKPALVKVVPLTDAGEIPGLINNLLKPSPGINIHKNFIDTAYITGDQLPASTVNAIKEATGLNFLQYNPFSSIKPSQSLISNINITEKANNFASAAGIAYRIA